MAIALERDRTTTLIALSKKAEVALNLNVPDPNLPGTSASQTGAV